MEKTAKQRIHLLGGMALLWWLALFSVWNLRCDGTQTEIATEATVETIVEGGVRHEGTNQETVTENVQESQPTEASAELQRDESPIPDAGESLPEGPIPERPRGLTQRVPNATCRFPAKPQEVQEMRMVRAYPRLSAFAVPLLLTYAPDGSNRVFVIERAGRIRVLNNDPNTTTAKVFLDITRKVRTQSEEGLLGLAFHPQYKQNGYFFVYYSSVTDGRSIFARFRVSANDPDQADPNSETLILEQTQPYRNHNGGSIEFGPDGYLYIALGDGGSAGDPLGHGQNLTTLLGAILRIDVDKQAGGKAYAIPADNPFVGRGGGVREEIWAYGLRNPWRMSFDPLSGDLWAGDVGQSMREEIDLIKKGGNYGWRLMEGTLCYNPSNNCQPPGVDLIKPIYEHPRAEAASITGGYVYRGKAIPSLYGAYVYGDYVTGNIWAMRYDGKTVTEHRRITGVPRSTLVSFGQDAQGEVYTMQAQDGHIYKFEKVNPNAGGTPLPARLSETGCFASLAPLRPADGLVPYSVRMPLWSDNVEKLRWLALPGQEKIAYQSQGRWRFPKGSVLVKHFQIPPSLHPQAKTQHIETRFMVHHDDGWKGYTYVWNETQDDAFLLEGSTTRAVEIKDPQQALQQVKIDYHVPSRAECLQCHNSTAGFALGLETRQLNAEHDYNGVRDNQLLAMNHIGLLDPPLDPRQPTSTYPAFPQGWTDPNASDTEKIRAYLDVNCAVCHQEGLNVNTAIDLRMETPLANMKICDVAPDRGDLGIPNARLLAPNQPERSVLYQRMVRRDVLRMPNIGALLEHKEATQRLRAWILGIRACP